MKERLEEFSIPEGESGIDFFLICPWDRVEPHEDGDFYISLTLYPNFVILTNSGKLVVLIRDTKQWYSSCLTAFGPKT